MIGTVQCHINLECYIHMDLSLKLWLPSPSIAGSKGARIEKHGSMISFMIEFQSGFLEPDYHASNSCVDSFALERILRA